MTAPLDTLANNVSPHPQNQARGGDASPTTSAKSAPYGGQKKHRHRLRRAAGRILPGERVAKCGQTALSSVVTLHHQDGHAHFGGIETCSSVWTCPVCAVRITEGRRGEIEAILDAHRNAGGTAFMATLTIPHTKFQRARDLRKAVTAAWRKVKNGKPWQRARDGHGWLGDIKALEVTHGENGWHPHLHVLMFFKPGTAKQDIYGFGGWLFDAWRGAIERLGYGTCRESAFTWDVVNADKGAGEYVGKWGVSLEMTKAHIKSSKGGRTPWQILRDFSETKSPEDRALFREYALAFKGARQLTWSRDLRAHYLGTDEEPSDEDLATEEARPDTQEAAFTTELFRVVAKRHLTAHVLAAMEQAGMLGVMAELNRFEIPWHLSEGPGLEAGLVVPYFCLGPHREPLREPPQGASSRYVTSRAHTLRNVTGTGNSPPQGRYVTEKGNSQPYRPKGAS